MSKLCIAMIEGIKQVKSGLVFLCHDRLDKRPVDRLRRRLEARGIRCWIAERDLGPGDWKTQIRNALHASTIVIVCLSRNFQKRPGYKEEELNIVTELATTRSEDELLVLPLKLEPVEVPYRLLHLQYLNLYSRGGFGRLSRGIKSCLLRHRAQAPRRMNGHLIPKCELRHRSTDILLSNRRSWTIRRNEWEAHIITDDTAPEVFHCVIQRSGELEIRMLSQEYTREAALDRCQYELDRLCLTLDKAA